MLYIFIKWQLIMYLINPIAGLGVQLIAKTTEFKASGQSSVLLTLRYKCRRLFILKIAFSAKLALF